jgi:hypothetical protein
LFNIDRLVELAGLDIDDASPKPQPFLAYELEPPSPPKLQSKGIISMDITETFTNAARGASSLKDVRAITC